MYALSNEAAKEESFGGWRKKNTDDKMVSVIISTCALLVSHTKLCKFLFNLSLNLLPIRKRTISSWES